MLEFNEYLSKEWRGLVVGPDALQRFERTTDRSIHHGAYFLFDGDRLVYVGQSCYVKNRIRQHRQVWRAFTHWSAIRVPADLLTQIETAYIHALRPVQNTTIPPVRDAFHDRIVGAIQVAWGVSAKTPVPNEGNARFSRV